jgi:hypothetical protein
VTENAIEPGVPGAYRRVAEICAVGKHQGRIIMLLSVVRVLAGFALASFAAAATLVLFVYAPGDLAGLSRDLNGARLSEAGFFALVITRWVALCAAGPALVGVLVAETYRIAGWPFYVLVGLATAMAGFFVQQASESSGASGIVEAYALIAFLTAGLIGGVVYWVFSGRYVAPAAGASAAPEPP